MCGIAGLVAFGSHPNPMEEEIRRMCDAMRYRGPDEEGLEIQGAVGMGMRRLAIIDLSGGQQPIHNEDGTVRVVFNGEIYNFKVLRKCLEEKGHVFKTRCDTEVLVHAYEEYGDDFPKHLNGMFAIALHDIVRNRVLLVRDHVGIKPLYVACDNGHLVWGSEIKVVLASGKVKKALNPQALKALIRWEYIPGELTLIREIRKLKPGHMMCIDLASPKLEQRKYWDLEDVSAKEGISEEDWVDRILEQLDRSVSMQMISDVPLGAFLSGGVDSSLVASAMGNAHTFSIGFDDPTYNELPWAAKVAEHLGVRHTTEILSSDLSGMFHDLMRYMDDPIGDFSIFPTYLVSALARKHVTVSLSGDGGDELFGGYETYLADEMTPWLPGWTRHMATCERWIRPSPAKKGLVNKAKRYLEGLGHSPALGHARWRCFLSDAMMTEVFSDEFLARCSENDSHIENMREAFTSQGSVGQSCFADFKTYLPDNILTKVDRMSMAVSLETRVPLLDKEMVELAFQVPSEFKVRNRNLKSILKKAAEQRLPSECIYRGKQGFSMPIKHWLNDSLKEEMHRLLDMERLRRQGLFHPEGVQRLIAQHHNGTHNHSHILWILMVFQQWMINWMEKDQ